MPAKIKSLKSKKPMKTIIKSPVVYATKSQLLDYVSKFEFNEFVGEMRDFRVDTNKRFDLIDNRASFTDKRFTSIDDRFSSIDKRFDLVDDRFSSIDKRFDSIDRRIDRLEDSIRTTIGTYYEQFREDLKTGLEYVQNIDAKKVDQSQFEALKIRVDRILQS
jgi:archaellum component FlaC